MKKITLTLGVVAIFSSCGLQFGDFDRYQQVHGNKGMCQIKGPHYHGDEYVTPPNEEMDEFYSAIDCENCDEVD
tara:strand:- start:237 stop:458 length:222 start_codon:yes stop_codon:yes gene_type:complete